MNVAWPRGPPPISSVFGLGNRGSMLGLRPCWSGQGVSETRAACLGLEERAGPLPTRWGGVAVAQKGEAWPPGTGRFCSLEPLCLALSRVARAMVPFKCKVCWGCVGGWWWQLVPD